MKKQRLEDAAVNPLKTVWAVSEGDEEDSSSPARLGWLLGALAAVLAAAVGFVAFLAIKRSETAMSDLLAEKGSSLLGVLESALRTGMRGPAGLQLQALLEEMTRSPDIEFVAVTMPDGVILAHSDRGRIGETLWLEGAPLDVESLAALDPGELEKWRVARAEGKRLFLLYRHFTLGHKDWASDVPEPTIFLGMDISPFEITRGQNRGYIIMLCLAVALVGFVCLLASAYARRASESRRKQRQAEGEVERLEKEIRRQEKLAAIGTLAAGVAHEIRNPLSSIKGYATYFKQKFPEDSEDREAAAAMLNEANRLNRVISDLLGLSARGELKLKPADLAAATAHVARLLRQNAASRGVNVIVRLAPRIPPALADMERISQALLNLCLNSLDAMSDGGTLTVAVSGGKNRICLIVRDTGSGIPPEIMEKIFDPYFTTKGSGTGLGLPMVYKIVRAHNGGVDVSSRIAGPSSPGGTIFRIWLPVARESGANEERRD